MTRQELTREGRRDTTFIPQQDQQASACRRCAGQVADLLEEVLDARRKDVASRVSLLYTYREQSLELQSILWLNNTRAHTLYFFSSTIRKDYKGATFLTIIITYTAGRTRILL